MSTKNIPTVVLVTATNVLQPYMPGLSPETLLQSITGAKTAKPEKLGKPLTRRECASLLSVSLNSINRYVKSGHLKAVKISSRLIRIAPESVQNLLENGVPVPEKAIEA